MFGDITHSHRQKTVGLAVLQSRSPTCGVNQIYDGSFSGKLIPDMGLFAQALKKKGCKVVDVESFIDELACIQGG